MLTSRAVQEAAHPGRVGHDREVNGEGCHGHCAEEDGNANRRLDDRPHFSVDHGVVPLLEPRRVDECQQVSQRRDHSENLRPLDQVAVNFFRFSIGQA